MLDSIWCWLLHIWHSRVLPGTCFVLSLCCFLQSCSPSPCSSSDELPDFRLDASSCRYFLLEASTLILAVRLCSVGHGHVLFETNEAPWVSEAPSTQRKQVPWVISSSHLEQLPRRPTGSFLETQHASLSPTRKQQMPSRQALSAIIVRSLKETADIRPGLRASFRTFCLNSLSGIRGSGAFEPGPGVCRLEIGKRFTRSSAAACPARTREPATRNYFKASQTVKVDVHDLPESFTSLSRR